MIRQPLKSKRPSKGVIASSTTQLAPIKGWNARDPEAAMPSGYAVYLDNWWPTPTEVQLRKGAVDHVTGIGQPVQALMAWQSASALPKLFAATALGIYDVTTAGVVGAAVQTITDGKCVHVNFTTTGASYLILVNGVDELRQYNGAWATVASYAISGGGTLLTPNIVNLNVFKRSLFFIEKDSMSFFYLAIDSIGGTVFRFPLGGVFSKGGKLVAMGTWTIDGGAGVDDFAVFVTSEGQLALYQGTDPSNPTTWALRGVYDLSSPIGKKCFLKFGGDLLFISQDGVYPMSRALQSTTVNAAVAVTDLISNAFSQAAVDYGNNFGWQGIYSFSDAVLLFNIPATESSISLQYAMNTKNGAWARFTDWNTFCWEILDDQLYAGMSGKVGKMWFGLNDFGGNINCYAKGAFTYLGSRGQSKQVSLLRPNLKVSGIVAIDVGIDMDFNSGLAFGPSVFSPGGGSLWGVGLWGAALWAASAVTKLDWTTVAVKEGYAAAVRLRVAAKDATVGWAATDIAYEMGAIQG